jgi:hypothetical protein
LLHNGASNHIARWHKLLFQEKEEEEEEKKKKKKRVNARTITYLPDVLQCAILISQKLNITSFKFRL